MDRRRCPVVRRSSLDILGDRVARPARALAVDGSGHVFASDRSNDRIEKFACPWANARPRAQRLPNATIAAAYKYACSQTCGTSFSGR